MSKRIAIVVAIALGVLGLFLLQQSLSNPVNITAEQEKASTTGKLTATGGFEGEQEDRSQEAENTRVAIPKEASTSDPKLGALLVRARWQDAKPAGGVSVALHAYEPVYHTVLQRLTNEQGMIEFTGLKPGKFWVSSDRGGQAEANVAAGKVAEATLDLKGVDVHGVVVDGTGAAVAGAGLWLTRAHRMDWLGGRVVTRSNTDGEFRIRGAPADQSLGALARGFAPSAMVDLEDVDTTKVPVRVRLVVASRGGAVTGIVRSPAGDPVQGADICVGSQPKRFRYRRGSSGYVETWTPLATSSDEQGHFELLSVAPGKHPVAVRSRGLPIWEGEVIVEVGVTARLEVRLLAGVVVHGVVKDGTGARIGGAVVRAYDRALNERFIQFGQFDYESVFGFPFTAADGKGCYRLSGIAPGQVHLYATRPGHRGHGETKSRAKIVLQGKTGEELPWDPIIEPGHSISGLVTYRNGVPMKHCFISVQNEKTEKRQSVTTNKNGRFLFTNLEAAYYKVRVQYRYREPPKGTPPLEQARIWPDMGEVRLVAVFDPPSKEVPGSVTGQVHDAAARRSHAAPLGVLLKSKRGGWYTGKANEDGAFKFKRVYPGQYRVVIMSGEQAIHVTGWFELAPAQHYQTGTIVTEPGGSLRIRILRNNGMEKFEPRIWAKHLETLQFREIRPGLATDHLEKNLCVGRYEIHASAKGLSEVRWTADVKVGREAVVELRLRRGYRCRLEVPLPVGHKSGKLDVTIHDSSGEVCLRVTREISAAMPNPYKRSLYLPLGSHTVNVTTSDGLAGETAFEVKDLGATIPSIRVALKAAK